MSDQLGLLVMLGVVLLLIVLLVILKPRRRTRDDGVHESVNADAETTAEGRRRAPEGAPGELLVGNPPIDTIDHSDSGTALPGTGAGGRTSDSHDPLLARPGDAADSPDE
jgi:hypothetical protein